MDGSSISLLVPACNEETTLASVVERGMAVLQQCSSDFEIIILDDASTDGTAAVIEELHRKYPEHIRALHHENNQGVAATFEELYRAASKEYVFLVSGDGQYPPEALLQCLPLAERHDIIVCQRAKKPYRGYRKVVSWGFRWLPKILFGVDLYDSGSIKLVKRTIFDDVPVTSQSVFVEAERLIRASRKGYQIGRVDIDQAPRSAGTERGAKAGLVIRAVGDMLSLWWRLQREKR